MRTGFAFPILVGETCTRVMSFFTCEDLALDQPLLAMRAAVGQEIGHFLQRIRAQEQLKARVRQQAAVAELGQAALAGSVLPDLMDRATRLVAETLDVELWKILEPLPGGRELLLKGGVGWGPRQVGRRKVSAARRSQAGYTLSVAEPVIVRDLRTETRFSAPPLLREQGAVSGVSVIIAGEEERTPYGVLAALPGTSVSSRLTMLSSCNLSRTCSPAPSSDTGRRWRSARASGSCAGFSTSCSPLSAS